MNHSIPSDNTALRKQLKQLRDTQTTQAMSRGSLLIRGRLFTWLATNQTRRKEQGKPLVKTIAAFWSLPQEPQLAPLLQQWVEEHDYKISLPVITGSQQVLEFRLWEPSQILQQGPFGLLEPVSGPLAPLPDVMLVPTLGFTRQGDRLGYGKGYYDRTLATLRAQGHIFTSLGIAWACGDLSNYNYTPLPHDEKLDGLLTDKGWPMPAPEI